MTTHAKGHEHPEGLAVWTHGQTHPPASVPNVRLIVVTPEKAAFDGVGDMVILPMHDGELGVLPGRAALIGRLGVGELKLKTERGATRFFIESGFVQVRADTVTVLTDRARKAAEITAELAGQAMRDLDAMAATTAQERANKSRARERALGMQKVAAHNAPA